MPYQPVDATEAPPAAVVANTPHDPKLTVDRDFARRFPLRILSAEDNLVNQRVACQIMQRLGYKPEVAGDGYQVLEHLERGRL